MSVPSLDLAMLSGRNLPVQDLDAGEKIFLEHDLGDCLYIVMSGTIEIVTLGKHLEQVTTGGIFGEVALVDDGARSASAMALEDSKVMQISRAAFLELVHDHPEFALQVMRSMAGRLRRTTER